MWPAGRSDGLVISLGLSGDLNYLQEGKPGILRTVQGNQKNITALTVDEEYSSSPTFFTGSSDGRICSYDDTGDGGTVDGDTHKNYISGLATSNSGRIYSVGWDDSLRSIDVSAKTFTGSSIKTDGQPRGVALTPSNTEIPTHKALFLLSQKHDSVIKHVPTNYAPTVLAAGTTHIAVAGDDSQQHMYDLDLNHIKSIPHPSQVTAFAFSPAENQYLAVGFSSGKIIVYEPNNPEPVITRWSAHTGRVMSIDWDENGESAGSGGLDTEIFVWSVHKPGQRVSVAQAHKEGVNGVRWAGEDLIVSVGGDAAVKKWRVDGVF